MPKNIFFILFLSVLVGAVLFPSIASADDNRVLTASYDPYDFWVLGVSSWWNSTTRREQYTMYSTRTTLNGNVVLWSEDGVSEVGLNGTFEGNQIEIDYYRLGTYMLSYWSDTPAYDGVMTNAGISYTFGYLVYIDDVYVGIINQYGTPTNVVYTWTSPELAYGNHTLMLRPQYYSHYGGTHWANALGMRSYGVDNTPPNVSVSADEVSWTTNPVAVTSTATDNLAGVEHNYCKLFLDADWTDSGTQPCVRTASENQMFYYYAADAFGNSSTQQEYFIGNIDTTAPELSASGHDSVVWTTNPVTVTISANDNGGSGVANLYCRLENGSWQDAGTGDCQISTSENAFIYAYAVDALGNTSNTETFAVSNIDLDPPEVTSSADITEWTAEDVTITANAVDINGIGVANLYCRLEGDSWTNAGTGQCQAVATENTKFYSYAEDALGNTSDVKEYVVDNIDKTPPEIAPIEAPPMVTPQSVSVSLNAFDSGSGLQTLQVKEEEGGVWINIPLPNAGAAVQPFARSGSFLANLLSTAMKIIEELNGPAAPSASGGLITFDWDATKYLDKDSVTFLFRATDMASNVTEWTYTSRILKEGPIINLSKESWGIGQGVDIDVNPGDLPLETVQISYIDPYSRFPAKTYIYEVKDYFSTRMIWDGLFGDGSKAENGLYLIKVKACDTFDQCNTVNGEILIIPPMPTREPLPTITYVTPTPQPTQVDAQMQPTQQHFVFNVLKPKEKSPAEKTPRPLDDYLWIKLSGLGLFFGLIVVTTHGPDPKLLEEINAIDRKTLELHNEN
ncbi:MAG: hypothetical protein JEZ06_08870 [Anaerolineaceae bacterium]|nr:hypothetical protein [Anaerolineaceae bacterium]